MMFEKKLLLEARMLSVSVRDLKILSEVSFQLFEGDVVSLVGPNGSGKSMLMKVISRVLHLQSMRQTGEIFFEGAQSLSQDSVAKQIPLKKWVKKVGYIGSEFTSDFSMTAFSALSTVTELMDNTQHSVVSAKVRIQNAMETAGCWDLRDRDLSTLSSGERQAVAMAKALIQDSKVIFFDETFSQMDFDRQAKMGRLMLELAKLGKAIVYVSHDFNFATEWATKVMLLKSGRLLATGEINETLTKQNFEQLYDSSSVTISSELKPKLIFRTF